MYGLDLYGVHESIHSISKYLTHLDPRAAKKVREKYSFFFPRRSVKEEEEELSQGILGNNLKYFIDSVRKKSV
jgi:erythromycin esterase-like protein